MDPAVARLAHRALRPPRPTLDEARAVVGDLVDAPTAWAALAIRGTIPPAFTRAPPPREFVPHQDWLYDPPPAAHPPTADACVAFASDPEGLVAAEALAAAVLARLAPWGVDPPARPAWSLMPLGPLVHLRFGLSPWTHFHQGLGHDPSSRPDDLVSALLAEHAPDADELRAPSWVQWFVERARFAGRWRTLTDRDAAVPPWDWSRGRPLPPYLRYPVGASFRELPDPFEPLLALWETGYDLLSSATGRVCLVAPALDPIDPLARLVAPIRRLSVASREPGLAAVTAEQLEHAWVHTGDLESVAFVAGLVVSPADRLALACYALATLIPCLPTPWRAYGTAVATALATARPWPAQPPDRARVGHATQFAPLFRRHAAGAAHEDAAAAMYACANAALHHAELAGRPGGRATAGAEPLANLYRLTHEALRYATLARPAGALDPRSARAELLDRVRARVPLPPIAVVRRRAAALR